jgi:hypothetical protein
MTYIPQMRFDTSIWLICVDWRMHRGAFVTLVPPHIKIVSLETIRCALVVCDCSHNHLYFSTCSTTSEVCTLLSIFYSVERSTYHSKCLIRGTNLWRNSWVILTAGFEFFLDFKITLARWGNLWVVVWRGRMQNKNLSEQGCRFKYPAISVCLIFILMNWCLAFRALCR